MSPSPAPRKRKIRAFTEDYFELSPDPIESPHGVERPNNDDKRAIPTHGARPSPFKRKMEPLDLTSETKKAKARVDEAIDLTEDD